MQFIQVIENYWTLFTYCHLMRATLQEHSFNHLKNVNQIYLTFFLLYLLFKNILRIHSEIQKNHKTPTKCTSPSLEHLSIDWSNVERGNYILHLSLSIVIRSAKRLKAEWSCEILSCVWYEYQPALSNL